MKRYFREIVSGSCLEEFKLILEEPLSTECHRLESDIQKAPESMICWFFSSHSVVFGTDLALNTVGYYPHQCQSVQLKCPMWPGKWQ